jgi:hypothetical protein
MACGLPPREPHPTLRHRIASASCLVTILGDWGQSNEYGICTTRRIRGCAVSSAGEAQMELRETPVIILGIVLLVVGYLLTIPILSTLGIILVVIGVILFVLGSAGRPIGGRRHYF